MTASNWNPSPIVQKGVVIRGAMRPGYEKVLTPEAIDFAVELEREFGAERRRLLTRRAEIQRRLDAGWKPDFLPETEAIRSGDWRVAAIPHDLEERRVEITGPTDRKIVINALNSGTNVFMADFEDANTPTWDNLIEGQANLIDAVRRTITFDVVRAWAAAALARVQPENPDAIPALVCDPQPARQNFRRPDRGSQVRSRLAGGERWIRTPSPRIIMLAVRCGRGYRARVVNYIRRPDPLPLGRTSIALLRRFEAPHLAARRGGQCSEASRTDQPSAGVPPRFVVVILHRPEGRSRERCRGPP